MLTFVRNVWKLSLPYFRSDEKGIARLLLITIIGLNLGDVYMNVQFNEWNNNFYNALQDLNKPAFFNALFRFSWLAAIYILIGVYRLYLNQILQIKWRRWMTSRYIDNWLLRQTYYRMQLAGSQADNPDQRIADDVGQFISATLDLTLGLLNSVVTLLSFLFILWNLSGPLAFTLAGYGVHIPGYMVWCALVYAAIGTWITVKLGWPLVPLNFDHQRYEANFRYSLVRLRENSESIAFYKGEEQEKISFLTRFGDVFTNYWAIIRRQKTLTWFTSGYYQIAIIFPYIVVAPRYFAKQIKLGVVMQTASAFGQVQGALSFIIGAYGSLASWKAVVDRLSGFTDTMDVVQRLEPLHPSSGENLALRGVHIKQPDGTPLLNNVSLSVTPGQSLLIKGSSGCGKTTLLRTLAGLWPYADGILTLPVGATLLFIPQRPYLPLGTLRQALYYPATVATDNEGLGEILTLCQLKHLQPSLDLTEPWSQILSPGEQQRVAFARVLLRRPDFVLLDEATSALDEPSEAYFYALIKSRLPSMGIVSIGHRGTLDRWHDNMMTLAENSGPNDPIFQRPNNSN